MKNIKLIWIVIFSFFISISWILYLEYYLSFHNLDYKKNWVESQKELIKNINSFSLDSVKNIENIYIKNTPDLELLDDIVYEIDSAKSRVYLEVYILTEKNIQKALKRAYDRWLDVKIILEKNVYKAPYLNVKAYDNLSNYWINVVWSNWNNYSLNHTKMLIVDNMWVISTWNYSYSTFKTNREFFIFAEDERIIIKLLDIFNNDFLWNKKIIELNELVLSPYSSRVKFTKLINSAKENIRIYSQNFSDEDILEKLIIADKKGVKVEIIFPDIKKIPSNIDEIELLNENWIDTYIVNNPYIHAKSIIVDNNYMYLWSINFSDYSIDKNREVWLIIKNTNLIENIVKIFEKDKLSIN